MSREGEDPEPFRSKRPCGLGARATFASANRYQFAEEKSGRACYNHRAISTSIAHTQTHDITRRIGAQGALAEVGRFTALTMSARQRDAEGRWASGVIGVARDHHSRLFRGAEAGRPHRGEAQFARVPPSSTCSANRPSKLEAFRAYGGAQSPSVAHQGHRRRHSTGSAWPRRRSAAFASGADYSTPMAGRAGDPRAG